MSSLGWIIDFVFSDYGVKVVVLFGSAARRVDFVPCLSDVDVFVLVERLERYHYDLKLFDCFRVSCCFFDIRLFEKVVYEGWPIVFHLYREGLKLLDRVGFTVPKPRVTRVTVEHLMRSFFGALSFAIDFLLMSTPDTRHAAHHFKHALRHLARYRFARGEGDAGNYPVYDWEVEKRLDHDERILYNLFRLAERNPSVLTVERAWSLLDELLSIAGREFKVRTPDAQAIRAGCRSFAFFEIKGDRVDAICEPAGVVEAR